MLIEEVDLARINALGNLLAHLVRATALNHLQVCPAILGFRTRRSTHEERVLQLSLQVILLDMVC